MGRYFAMRVMHSNKNLKIDGVTINRPFENLYNCVYFLEFFNHQNDLKVQHHIISVCHNRTVPMPLDRYIAKAILFFNLPIILETFLWPRLTLQFNDSSFHW